MSKKNNSNFVRRFNHLKNGDQPFVLISSIIFLIPGILYISVTSPNSFIFQLVVLLLTMPFSWTVVFAISELFFRLRGTYYIRPIKNEEYKDLINKKLIHYTNKEIFVKSADESPYREIRLVGKISAASNYEMRGIDKRKRFVWFHQEEGSGTNEPNVTSYIFSHGHEVEPRKYKVIIDPSDLDKECIYIRPSNGNIVYKGEVCTKAIVEEDFNCYEDEKYWRNLRSPILLNDFWHMRAHKIYGALIDRFY